MEEVELDPTLHDLINSNAIQWVFVGGKGGVGKTTTSCSIAIQLAKRRRNVLILSTDPAHNLSDAFSQKFTNTPTPVKGYTNLFAMEIDSSLRESSAFKIPEDDELGLGKMLPELLSAFPGIDEAMSFAELMQAVQTMNYSVIVFDTAPTGHTLRLLSFPDLLEKAFQKFQSLKDKMSGAFSMLNALSGSGEQDELSAKMNQMRAATTSVREMFKDPAKTTFVCVCIPEFLSLYETERLVQELTKQEIDASYIVVNQILFPVGNKDEIFGTGEEFEQAGQQIQRLDPSLGTVYAKLLKRATDLENSHNARRKMQSRYLTQIRELYAYDFHVVPVPLQADEVRGLSNLEQFGALLLTKRELPILG
eukprot:Protomagalhaensia_sp_Gyna_25__5283@NODE_655_length_2902_cov_152_818722_g511_i0_p1_GENE_NODE_655_length_2902_cov_152_818722_g511_i0NODE_655_length_2902_cov_152_818722_g511_i0_p1_ORF_typecomplete_len364_score70_26ArsA_ATPase/PF02374_15/4_7e89AAA_31/PF13614_6/6_1e14AAA_31/PF13614_6/1_1e02AAA_31/PF13614_6/3e02CbiA/PF01656_23/5_1e12ParA/PF10609_9/2e10CBP_BcsQ/PF06564_12/1_8e10CBP_BcsQ/PF06564_12/1_4e02CBP_BcsQ/PF06564_12/4_6e03Fer4_NifH/PF00142_18/3_4e07Fer4_NifH/PF00142_18/14VirC1/PF07015_11/4_4e08V